MKTSVTSIFYFPITTDHSHNTTTPMRNYKIEVTLLLTTTTNKRTTNNEILQTSTTER